MIFYCGAEKSISVSCHHFSSTLFFFMQLEDQILLLIVFVKTLDKGLLQDHHILFLQLLEMGTMTMPTVQKRSPQPREVRSHYEV